MEYLEFSSCYDKDLNRQFIFHPLGGHSQNEFGCYDTVVTLNELGMELDGSIPVLSSTCNCNSFKITKNVCKHIVDAMNIIERRGIKLKDMALVRYICPVCKEEISAPAGSQLRCSCNVDMVKYTEWKKQNEEKRDKSKK